MSKKEKLLKRLLDKPKDFTWKEAVSVMEAHNFDLFSNKGSSRTFVHREKKIIVRLHEPHPRPTLLPYMVKGLIEGLKNAGEIE